MSSMASLNPPRGDGDGDGAVCCMCGDRGLPHELFRCRFCRVRLQHRYCSDLYPRATAYRRCNWCLREPADGGGGDHAHANARAVENKPTEKRIKAAAPWTETSTRCNWCLREPADGGGGDHAHANARAVENKPTEKRIKAAAPWTETSTLNEVERQSHLQQAGCSALSRVAPELGRPIKKQKVEEKTALLPPAPGAAKVGSSSKKPMQAAGKMARPSRVKVRRYKLLAEVIISC